MALISRSKPLFGGIIIAVALILVLSMTFPRSTAPSQAAPDGCLPTSMSKSDQLGFTVKEPDTALISHAAQLQAVVENVQLVELYYSDFSLCPFDDSYESFLQKGGVKVVEYMPEETYQDGKDFQAKQLEYYQSNPNIVADVEPIEVNGHLGIGWGPYESKSVVRLNGEIIESTPKPGFASITYFDESDGTIYNLMADRSLDELLKIAGTIR